MEDGRKRPGEPQENGRTSPRYLALGDSYTIGVGVAPLERFPVQLVALLRARGVAMAEPVIVAQDGWTTDELAAGIDQARPNGPYELVTLLIGVNNQYRERDLGEYRTQYRDLLQRAVNLAGGDPRRVIVVSIPDWGVTPFAAGRDRGRIAAAIDRFNAVKRDETERAGAAFVDVTAESRRAADDSTLLAADGLHPSGTMYAGWARRVLPLALGSASKRPGKCPAPTPGKQGQTS
ncbi:MAG: SGNH/GDSL hydrolase family protein [bacterium]|nr:SGNH/GDSL hydrolase family protein [bacterium]